MAIITTNPLLFRFQIASIRAPLLNCAEDPLRLILGPTMKKEIPIRNHSVATKAVIFRLLAGCVSRRAADLTKDSAPAADEDKAACLKHLKQIYEAIQSHRREHKDIPNWLSDLVPKYSSTKSDLSGQRTGQRFGGLRPIPKPTSRLPISSCRVGERLGAANHFTASEAQANGLCGRKSADGALLSPR